MPIFARIAASVGVIVMALAQSALADTDAEARIKELEVVVKSLERRVTSLEAQGSTSVAAPERSVIPGPPQMATWRKLKQGMTEAQVEAMLGSPTKIDANPVFIRWVYGEGSANVMFESDSHLVQGWSEP